MNSAGPGPSSRPDASRLPIVSWIVWTLFIVYGTTIPFHFTSDRAFILDKLAHVTINPFISPDTGRRVSITDTVQNVLLFLPFGVFGVIAIGDRVRWAITRIAIVTGLAAMLSASIETLQLFMTDRTTSASDAATNTIGAFGGAIAAHAVIHIGRRAMHRLRALGLTEVPSFYPMLIASIVLCLAAWEPFDVTLDVGSLIGKVHALRAAPWQFVVVGDEGVEIVRYALFGLITSSWLRQLGLRRAAGLGALVGMGTAVVLEASQWVIASRMPGPRRRRGACGRRRRGGCALSVGAARALTGVLVRAPHGGDGDRRRDPDVESVHRRGRAPPVRLDAVLQLLRAHVIRDHQPHHRVDVDLLPARVLDPDGAPTSLAGVRGRLWRFAGYRLSSGIHAGMDRRALSGHHRRIRFNVGRARWRLGGRGRLEEIPDTAQLRYHQHPDGIFTSLRPCGRAPEESSRCAASAACSRWTARSIPRCGRPFPAMTARSRIAARTATASSTTRSVALGHRRLAIIDRAGGHQPMANEDGSCWIVFNGEIYNHRELRPLLEAKGHRFRTSCDTEVILHAYEEFGRACVDRLEGMFAFAIYDGRRQELFAARDRLGKKPFFYTVLDGMFHFASELPALAHSPLWRGDVDLTALEGLPLARLLPRAGDHLPRRLQAAAGALAASRGRRPSRRSSTGTSRNSTPTIGRTSS